MDSGSPVLNPERWSMYGERLSELGTLVVLFERRTASSHFCLWIFCMRLCSFLPRRSPEY